MNVVGLDLSLTATGVATVTRTEVLRPKATGPERLAWIRDAVLDRCRVHLYRGGYAPDSTDPDVADLVVLEGYAYGRPNQAHQIGELGGVIRVALWEARVPYVEVPPAVLKKYATGHGNAGKGEVMASAIRRLGYEGHDDNEADADWLRTMALDHYGLSRIILPAAHREALGKVDWPELGERAA